MKFPFAVGLSLALGPAVATAATVLMDTGERFQGQITGMSSGSVQLQGEFGRLSLPWSRIVELEADEPLQATLSSGARLNGTIRLRQGSIGFLEPGLNQLTLPVEAIVALAPVDTPDLRLEARLNVGLAATNGNTDTESYHVNGEFIARGSRNRFRLGGQYKYASEESRRTENNASAALSYDHFLSDNWYLNTNFGLARDEFKDLALRTTAGIGMGYQFWDRPGSRLATELGVSYIHEDFDEAEDRGQPAARYALDFLRRLTAGPTLFHHHEVLAGLEHGKDILLHAETGLRLTLLENVTGTVQINYDYDWKPAPGTERADTTYLITIGYSFLP